MAPNKKPNQNKLGAAIIRSRFGSRRPKDNDTRLFTTEPDDSHKWEKYQSITQENDLDAFLHTAELAETEFVAERLNVHVVSKDETSSFLLSKEKEVEMRSKMDELKHQLVIPRRPNWTNQMTGRELKKMEQNNFLEWRAGLALLEEGSEMILTPFERNLEVWRQLWRVIERSDLIVQIVDARNPLFFRCPDLEKYVFQVCREQKERDGDQEVVHSTEGEFEDWERKSEIDLKEKKRKWTGDKFNLLVVNKADFLTLKQRQAWSKYFNDNNIPFVFFSAAQSNAELEKQELAKKHQEDVQALETESDEEINEIQHNSQELNNIDIDKDVKELSKSMDSIEIETLEDPATHILSADELALHFLQPFKDTPERKITVGFVGYPNVGKSSTLNALLGAKKTNVSATPGKTKHFQTHVLPLHLNNSINSNNTNVVNYLHESIILCDCPGLVFPSFATTKADMVVNGVLPIDHLKEPIGPTELVVQRIPSIILEWLYGIQFVFDEPEEEGVIRKITARQLLCSYAVSRGFMKAGQGNPDESRAARYILKDYVNGRILFCVAPPSLNAEEKIQYNQETYFAENGVKHDEYLDALTRENNNEESLTNGPQKSTFDSYYFKGQDNHQSHVIAKIKSKKQLLSPLSTNGQRVGFERTQMFPHQSGYSVSGSVRGSVTGTIVEENSKKHFKKLKHVKKDRSWRAK